MRLAAAPIACFVTAVALCSCQETAPRGAAVILRAGDGETVFGRSLIKVSPVSGLSGVSMALMKTDPGGSSGRHVHDRSDQIIVVERGSGTITLDTARAPVGPGDVVVIPHGVWHDLAANAGGLVVAEFFSPAGVEDEFREGSKLGNRPATFEELERIGARHGSRRSSLPNPGHAIDTNAVHGAVVPLRDSPFGFEVVRGDPSKAGQPYVVRIQNDAGFVVLPHTHPEDENIVVIRGSWSLAMGRHFDRSALQPLEVGDNGFVGKKMPHYGLANSELVIQVHGIGPFSTDFVDPLYQLDDKGVTLLRTAGVTGASVAAPAECFHFKVGQAVQTDRGSGKVAGALCSPASRFTQYWVEPQKGARFWSASEAVSLVK